jgi:hypothetical protein
MQLTHPTTGATKTLPDDADVTEYTDAGWQVSSPPAADEDSADESADDAASAAGTTSSKEAESAEAANTTAPTTQDEVDAGHAGLQVDEGATTAETGTDPA